MMSTGRAFVESSGVGALVVTRRLQRQSARSQVVNALTPRTVNAVASSNGHSKRSIPKSFVWPSGPRQFEADKEALLYYIDEENREGILAGILSRGLVDVKRHSNYGKPLLYEAVEKGHASCVQLLLDAGLTDDKMDYYGWNCLMCAAHLGRDRELEMLLRAAREHLPNEAYQSYVNRNAGVRGNDAAGDTALHMAVRGNFPTAVLLLLTGGANASLPNTEGKKPRDVAADSVVRKLVERAEQGPSSSEQA